VEQLTDGWSNTSYRAQVWVGGEPVIHDSPYGRNGAYEGYTPMGRSGRLVLTGLIALGVSPLLWPPVAHGFQCAQLRAEHGKDINDWSMSGPESANRQPDSKADYKRYRYDLGCAPEWK
jgi:hypothetical protein